MFETGLVSVSFRKESPQTIIRAVSAAGLGGIEWGGDIHVPHGDLEKAQVVGKGTREAGLKVMAYGSYYRLGCSENAEDNFKEVAETALTLGAPVIRIWAGGKGSAETTAEIRSAIEEEAFRLAEIADQYGIDIALECHNNTLTDNFQSSLDLINKVNHPRLKMYWQPNQLRDCEYNRLSASGLAPVTVNLHVFHWDDKNRYPLEEGTRIWQTYLEPFRASERDYGLLLEFMHDDQIETLNKTAETLLSWI